MIEPIRIPEFLKVLARSVRDNRLTSFVITRALRTCLPPARQNWAARRVPPLGEIRALLPNGSSLRLDSAQAELVHSLIFYRGWTGDEPETLPLWFSLAGESRTIIDVGAHIGHFSITAALANPQAIVHAFEPHPTLRTMLERNVTLNGVKNIVVHSEALGYERKEAEFFVMPHIIPSSSSLSESFMRSAHQANDLARIPVLVDRLDAILPDIGGPVLMKIDTESTEPDVIVGAQKLIEKYRPKIFVEVLASHDTGPQIETLLGGYTPYLLTDEGPVKAMQIRGNAVWRNFLMIPKEV
jgi:FkbM family methyltransferase